MRMKAMDELKNIGPTLSKIKREQPFTVPDGYFDNFQARLDDAIKAKKDLTSAGTYRFVIRPYMAAAVLLIVALLAGTAILRKDHGNKADDRFHAEISLVVEQELYSISEETILETLATGQSDKQFQKQANSDEMINYLLNEDINEEELLNTL